MESVLLTHPIIVIVSAMVIGYLGKYLFVSKDIGYKLTVDRKDENHALELSFNKSIADTVDKMRVIQQDIMRECDQKYFTKEMAEKHNQRIEKVEDVVQKIMPMMEKIDLMYDLLMDLQHQQMEKD